MNALDRLALAALVGVLCVGCGGDDDSSGNGGDDAVEMCKQGCRTSQSLCYPDAGDTSGCENACASRDGGTSPPCTNQSEITSAFKTCLQKTTCQDFTICVAAIPRCKGTGDAGGQ